MVTLRTTSGFTLIEMLVSLALFTVVAVIALGTLLSLISGNSRVVGEQSVLTTLSFIIDSMSREIRTGSEYYCGSVSQVTAASVTGSSTVVRNCFDAFYPGISFREAGESITGGTSNNRVAYYFQNNMIYRKVGTNTGVPIVANDVRVIDAKFMVTGATPLGKGTDKQQPSVTMYITAQASSSDLTRSFTVESTVVQRPLDI